MTGYEKSPDYGGAPVTRRTYVGAAVMAVVVVAIVAWMVVG